MGSKEKVKKPFYKKWWVWLIAIIIIFAIGSPKEETEKASESVAPAETEAAETTNATEETTSTEAKTEEESEEAEVVEEEEVEVEEIPREHKAALQKAESYAQTMHMSKKAIYDQLVSEYGEQFPEEAAQYAMDNLEYDWKANALKKAESYAEDMAMSTSAVYDQLVSEYGEQFTPEEAQYAIDNLK
ncbi:Ltp family lipoprotein [Planomicrobium sp. CPCC 101079]|uniref:Ltp family lipoprotein n=1 Tax=Planomicrobium sp. CPCC 101079 TaxID=2599618 RepID=UPI001645620D|nr:Ltp family lipoprotein [Planomicrobium sp. CPCC 101079]